MGEVQQIAELPSEPKIVPNMKGWETGSQTSEEDSAKDCTLNVGDGTKFILDVFLKKHFFLGMGSANSLSTPPTPFLSSNMADSG